MLASAGVIGPFLVPSLLLLGLPSGVARGTCLVSELLMTAVSLIGYKKAGNMDKRVILAFLPGALTALLGANVSLSFPESITKVAIGIFEITIGILLVFFATKRLDNKPDSSTVISTNGMVKLMAVALFAGFAKGFFGVGWGPIGVGLFILLGIDPRITVGSSLVIRLLLDGVGGFTYVSMNLIDVNAVIVLTLAGCVAALLAVKLTTKTSGRNLCMFIGVLVAFLGALVIIETVRPIF